MSLIDFLTYYMYHVYEDEAEHKDMIIELMKDNIICNRKLCTRNQILPRSATHTLKRRSTH